MSDPRPLSLVHFVLPEGQDLNVYPFELGKTYLFLGEIPNMPGGHCVVLEYSHAVQNTLNALYVGYHTDNFRELTEEET